MATIDVQAEVGSTPIWGVPFSDQNLLRSMQKSGVEKSIILSTVGDSVDFQRGNAQVAKIAETNSALAACLVVNFNYPELSQKEMQKYMGQAFFAGILLSSGNRERYVVLQEAEDMLNAYRRFIKPVFIRTTDKDSILAANEIAKAFPVMKFILLGMGGEDWRIATVVAEKTLNLVLEVSGSFSPEKVKFASERVGSHRMVFGSGLPYVDTSEVKALVEDADITDVDKRNIMENTARKLFGWRRQA